MAIYRFTKSGAGTMDGSDWPDALAFDAITGYVGLAMPGDAFLVGFDRDREDPVFWSGTPIPLDRSGEPDFPIRIAAGYISQPDNVQPSGMRVNFRRSGLGQLRRTNPDIGGAALILLRNGASNVQLSGFGFAGASGDGLIGFGDADSGGPFSDIRISGLSGTYAGRVIESHERARIGRLIVEDCDAYGLVRGFARFFELSNSVLRNLHLDAGGVDGGGSATTQLIRVVKGDNVLFEHIWLGDAVNGLATEERGSDYVQGDGIVCEEETSGFVFRDCHARGMGDGGFDLKTQNVLMEDCSTTGCKNGARIWSRSSNVLRRCSFTNPISLRELSSSIQCRGTAELIDCRLHAGSEAGIIRFTKGDGDGPKVSMHGGEILMEEGALLIQGDAGTLELDGVKVNGETRTDTIVSTGGPVR
jgi:hypothetical protein